MTNSSNSSLFERFFNHLTSILYGKQLHLLVQYESNQGKGMLQCKKRDQLFILHLLKSTLLLLHCHPQDFHKMKIHALNRQVQVTKIWGFCLKIHTCRRQNFKVLGTLEFLRFQGFQISQICPLFRSPSHLQNFHLNYSDLT